MNVIDLFAGCGGFSEGFRQEGFNIVAAIEIWEPAVQTYMFNHPDTPILLGDIRTEKEKLFKQLEGKSVDVVIGGPPCQGFSLAGNRNPID
ncbi:MAG: DNA cytosine methyltransferase, partial [Promethearchaeota archaeon]